MTKTIPLALLASALLFTACGSDASATGGETTGPAPTTAPADKAPDMSKGADADAATATTPAGIATSLSTLLDGITDGASATAAKAELEGLTNQLGTAMANLKSAGASGDSDATKMLGDLAKKAAAAISPELTKSFEGISAQITSLMSKPEIQSAIGPILEKLKGFIGQ